MESKPLFKAPPLGSHSHVVSDRVPHSVRGNDVSSFHPLIYFNAQLLDTISEVFEWEPI